MTVVAHCVIKDIIKGFCCCWCGFEDRYQAILHVVSSLICLCAVLLFIYLCILYFIGGCDYDGCCGRGFRIGG